MIEKVAKSICMAQWGGYPLDEKARNEWPEWRQAVKLARAAIEAMREPTEDMISDGWTAHDMHGDYGQGNIPKLVFEAMIESAIKERTAEWTR